MQRTKRKSEIKSDNMMMEISLSIDESVNRTTLNKIMRNLKVLEKALAANKRSEENISLSTLNFLEGFKLNRTNNNKKNNNIFKNDYISLSSKFTLNPNSD